MTPAAERIISLNEHDVQPSDLSKDQVEKISQKYARERGEYSLRPVQALALEVIERAGGMVGAIGVGAGKSLIGLLASKALNKSDSFDTHIGRCEAMYLCPASLQETVKRERDKWAKHFDVDRYMRIKSYGKLSHKSGRDMMERYQPKLVVLDEAHKVANAGAARTGRILDYLKDNPGVHLISMSGTLTNRSIEDYRHFLIHALGAQNSPLPNEWIEFEGWKRVLDPGSSKDVLPNPADWRRVSPIMEVYGSGKRALDIDNFEERTRQAREAYLHRFRTTPGVVKTEKSAAQCSLRIRVNDLEVPKSINGALQDIDDMWLLPDGDEISDQLSFYRARRQASGGFYYRWDWDIEPYGGERDVGWLNARKDWAQAERQLVNNSSLEDVDTPHFAREAVREGRVSDPEIVQRWNAWKEHSHKPRPPTEGVRLDDFLLEDAISRARSSSRASIIWYSFRETADWLDEKGVEVYFPGGRDPEEADPDKQGVIACSIASHARGKNLQQFSHSVVLTPPSSGTRWEQLLGRTHRPGQQEDEVLVDTYNHTEAFQTSLEKAVKNARFTRQTEGCKQKLLYADWIPAGFKESV